jgi:hypothetical protein
MTLLVARVAVATSISPNELLEAPPEVFWAMVAVLQEQAKESQRG